jgi:hypothetical protein
MEIENLDIKQQFLKSLNERQRRQYLGQLSLDLGHGGIKLVCETFSINPVSIRTGIRELCQRTCRKYSHKNGIRSESQN